MKISPKVDFPVQVILESEELEGPDLHYFEGIYRAVLNHVVTVVFVPDVRGLAPPWDDSRLPHGVDLAEDRQQARPIAALLASYVVTPHDELAGQTERIPPPPGAEVSSGVVFYVTAAEFGRYAADLAELSEIVYRPWPEQTASSLRRYPVVRYLEQRVADSGLLRPADAAILGRPATAASK